MIPKNSKRHHQIVHVDAPGISPSITSNYCGRSQSRYWWPDRMESLRWYDLTQQRRSSYGSIGSMEPRVYHILQTHLQYAMESWYHMNYIWANSWYSNVADSTNSTLHVVEFNVIFLTDVNSVSAGCTLAMSKKRSCSKCATYCFSDFSKRSSVSKAGHNLLTSCINFIKLHVHVAR